MESSNIRIQKRLYSIKEAGLYLGRSAWSVAEMLRTGRIPYVSDGKRRFLDIKDLESWILRNKITPEEQEKWNG